MTAPDKTVSEDIIATDHSSVWYHLTQLQPGKGVDPLVIVEGKGMRVTDAGGREYLDATSGGVWTVNVGYGREEIARAVHDQLVKMCYFAGSAANEAGGRYASALLRKIPGMGKVD